MKKLLKKIICFLLAINMAFSGAVPALAFELETVAEEISFSEEETELFAETEETVEATGTDSDIVPLFREIEVLSGQLDPATSEIIENEIYGSVVGCELKKGHTLSISNTDYVFSVRVLENGNYSKMLKQATVDNFVATEDMTIGMLIRKPDKSALTAEEIASVKIIDSQYGMINVPGYAHRFTVEAKTIEGGTATTRAAIFLPESYSEYGEATKLVLMTNGARGHLSDSIWNNGTADDIALMKNYMEAGYAVLVADNTAGKVGGAQDWGNPQHVDSYFKAYEYAAEKFNVEKQFYIHSRSMGTMAATRIMRERPELVKCAIMCGAVSSLEAYFKNDPSFIAKRFGFDDKTGATYEADKVVGYDTYADIAGAMEYSLPPTFWMLSEADATERTLGMIDNIESFGNDVSVKTYSATDHSGVCRLNIEECWNDAVAYFEEYEESKTEHRFCAWEITKEATCTENGEMQRKCADCDYSESIEIEKGGQHIFENGFDFCSVCGEKRLGKLYVNIPVEKNKLQIDGTVIADSVYGHIKDYNLGRGRTISISSAEHVFSVRQLLGGNYSTQLKVPATAESYTAKEDIAIGAWVRRPDSGELSEGELDSIYMIDSIYGMVDVPGYVHRFTVEAETIEGGTATTRAAIFLPETYSEKGEATKLVLMTNGYSAYLTESKWNGNTADNVGIIRNYLNAGYAVYVVNNTKNHTGKTPDLGCPQLVDSYLKAYEYIQENFNVEEKITIHSRSFGTFAAVRIMLEVPELIKCAVMTGARVSIKAEWPGLDKAFIANRFGFEDATGATYEADKMVGHDPYTDVNSENYELPPTFWMLAEGDSTAKPLEFIGKLEAHGNSVRSKIYSGIDHTGICTLNQPEPFADALAFLEEHGEPSKILSLRYDDRYDISGKTVEIVDAGKPTSYKVGYGVAEGTPDDAVITLSGEKLIATGIGTAKVRIDGVLCEITVEAAPISLLLLIGQSNMEGMVGNANQSIANENGQVYSTYAEANGLTGDAGLTVENAGNYVPSALSGEYSTVNVNGNDTKLSGYPVNSLTESGSGKYGMDSGIAYEWVKQTGEKVWIVNAAHGASSISSWQKGESNFEEAVALFSACEDVLLKEIAAGHYTFSHMGYYWCQGCADEQQTAEWYANKYIAMHDNLKAELAFDADLDENTEDVTFEFGNIVLVMAGHENATGYRKGIYEDSSDKFFATFKELEMRGPRVAQIWLANNPELEDIYIVSTVAQDWVTMPDGSDGVEEYFLEHYENGTIDYPTQVKQKESWYKPTTPAEVKNSIHYYQVGYNEVGRESVRNTMYILGIAEKPEVETTVTFYDWTGYKEVSEIKTVSKGISETLAVPFVYPCYESKNVTYNASENLEYLYYDLLDKESKGGILSDSLGQNEIPVVERETYSYRFELSEGEMVSVGGGAFTENPLKRADKTHKYYKATTPIILRHDKEWLVEFFSEQGERFIALSCQGWFSSKTEYSDNAYFIFKRTDSGKSIISFGEYKNQQYEYWGIKQGMADIDWDLPHVYSFRNVINEDGSNIIHIFIDNQFVGTASNRIINNVVTATDESYFSGKDFLFPFVGAGGTFALNSEQMIWMNVWESGHTHSGTSVDVPPTCTEMGYTDYTCPECGISYQSDYIAATGHTFGEWIVSEEATLYKPGEEYRECEICGFIETREIPETRYKSFRFELKEGELVSVTEGGFDENPIERAFPSQKVYKFSENVVLQHDKEWRVDFYSEDAARFMALSTTASSGNGQFYIFKSKTGTGVLSFGEYKDGLYENYGTLQRDINTDWSLPHTYSFRNRLNEDGTNTIEIYMDDVFVCTATDKIVNEVLKETGSSYLSGKDFVFPYIGASGFALNDNQIVWMEIYEDVNAEKIGDINLDGSVNVKDAYYARLVAAKLIKPTDEQIALGDVDLDGKITAIDANIIRKFVAKIIDSLPVGQ